MTYRPGSGRRQWTVVGERTFEDQLEELGFVEQGRSRRGGAQWALPFSRFLTFTLHDFREHVVLTWRFDLGEFMLARGWLIGAGDTSFQELYPQRDAKLPVEIAAVEAEITRILGTLRLDLADPSL